MAELSSYIIIDRNILKWSHYKDTKCLAVFLWLILNANPIPKRGEKKYFNRGEVITTNEQISQETGVSLTSVRRAIEILKKSGEIMIFRQKYNSKIVVKNYRKYQNQKAYKRDEQAEGLKEDEANESVQIEHFSQAECSKPTSESVQNQHSRVFKNGGSIYNPTNVVLYTTKEEMTKEKKTKERTRTRDDIPFSFRDRFETYEDYEKWRNQ